MNQEGIKVIPRDNWILPELCRSICRKVEGIDIYVEEGITESD